MKGGRGGTDIKKKIFWGANFSHCSVITQHPLNGSTVEISDNKTKGREKGGCSGFCTKSKHVARPYHVVLKENKR